MYETKVILTLLAELVARCEDVKEVHHIFAKLEKLMEEE